MHLHQSPSAQINHQGSADFERCRSQLPSVALDGLNKPTMQRVLCSVQFYFANVREVMTETSRKYRFRVQPGSIDQRDHSPEIEKPHVHLQSGTRRQQCCMSGTTRYINDVV
ncbi:hypothetical protein PAXRUDRAFT_780427 [Paxillus rubicundulus Ve08.2h10]|uniref:Unplaced genomic scaffold scaffold_2489, whole genome shotgun sequence n=1 Tax=Paxillus rubicundulus Ve08.2h10 TaxID=930991 RepID=A0A0D0DFZ4_9AGAM|nr:hypothetical protein PAXRUDRAFT_780427 [Paxillus rubicundulus Ve08.2h10]